MIRVGADEVFQPDIMLYNAADIVTMRDNMIKTKVLLYSSGKILSVPPVILRSHCDVDLTNWPYDEQDCFLKFGSWTHDGLGINLDNSELLKILYKNDLSYSNS